MSDRISRTQAITRVMLATKLTRADAEEWLDDAFPVQAPPTTRDPVDFRDPLRRYAGGMTYVDLEDPKIAALFRDDEVELDRLEEALADLLGTQPTPAVKPPSRPKGRSYEAIDAPLVEQMRQMIVDCVHPSPTAAAWAIVGRDGKGAYGNSTALSKVDRLVGHYTKRYRD